MNIRNMTFQTYCWTFLFVVLFIRLVSLALYPFMDTTEARYGEMARLMIETGNWLTPLFDYDVPFWGKPPLFVWMSATFGSLLGVSEFSLRLPHWLAGVVVIGFVMVFARTQKINEFVAAVVLSSCAIFYIAAGAVMTDMALTLSMTIALVGFYLGFHGNTVWVYLGFAGLGLGLLAKGPVALVLVGLVVVPWLVIQYGVKSGISSLFQRIPMFFGLALMCVIATPWYFMAEQATPGFLDYFIIGEHFNRFIVSGWEGDLYGQAHDRPRGMIWLFWLVAAMPWSFILIGLLLTRHKRFQSINAKSKGLFCFLVIWLLSPLILFTMSGNILATYVLPGIPALALLIPLLLGNKDEERTLNSVEVPGTVPSKFPSKAPRWIFASASTTPVLFAVLLMVVQAGEADRKSEKFLLNHASDQRPIYYLDKRPHSGQFYSQGQAKLLSSDELVLQEPVYLVGKVPEVDKFIRNNSLDCTLLYTSKSKRVLYQCD